MDAGAETGTQESLFGEEVITESYFFAERAKVLDQAVKQLRKEQGIICQLSKNQKRLEAEGNKLAQSANKRRADNDSQAIGLLKPSQTSKGRSRTASQQQPAQPEKRAATDELLMDSLKMSDERFKEGDFDRFAAGDAGRIVNDTPQSSRVRQSQSQT